MRLVSLAIAWCIGISVAHHPALHRVGLWWLLAGAAGAACLWFYSDRRLRLPAFLLAAFVLGGWRMALTPDSAPAAAFNDRAGAVFTGTVIDEPIQRDDGTIQFTLDSETVDAGAGPVTTAGRILVRTDALASPIDIQYGDRVRAHGTPITPPRIDSFDYAAYLARSDIFTLLRDARLEVIGHPGGHPVITFLLAVKTRLRSVIETTLPDPAAALLRGILLGDDALPDTIRADFAAAGTAHIVAVSGFNLAVVAGVSGSLIRLLGGGRRRATIAALAATTLYALLVGMTGGVFRAWVMISVVILGDLLRRRSYVPTSLALSILLLTVIEPRDLLDVSFQMSAAAALGLAVLTRPLSHHFQRVAAFITRRPATGGLSQAVTETLAATLAAFIFVTPFTAYYFGRVSVVTVPVNLLVAAVQPLLLLGGAAGALIGTVVPAVGSAILLLLWPALAWTLSVTRGAARLPFADVSMDVDVTALSVLIVAAIGSIMLNASRPIWFSRLTAAVTPRTLLATAALSILLIGAVSAAIGSTRPDGRLHLWVLDMNGDNALLLQTPGGAHILVDGGSSPRRLLTAVGDRLPVNKRHIDLLIITAPQAWNASALLELLSRYSIGSALISDQVTPVTAINQVYASLPPDTTVRAHAGHQVVFSDGTGIDVLYPSVETIPTADPADTGLVLRVTSGAVTFLLTGDLSSDGQAALLELDRPLHADLLQIPGGGVDLSSAFMAQAAPSAAFAQPRTSALLDLDVLESLAVPWHDVRQTGDQHWWTDGYTLWYAGQR